MNYIALGHIHNPPAPKKAGSAVITYPGCTVGRDFGECGDKGVYVGVIDSGRIDLSFRPLSDSRFIRESVDVTGAENDRDIAERIGAQLSGRITERDGIRLTLTGSLPAGMLPAIPAIKAMIPPAAIWQIKDDTTPAIDYEELKRDITLRGEFYRKLLPMLEGENENERKTAEQALKFGLCAINGVSIDEI
jgi:DNA repair exonuclease SbcCD nuclease subunit